MSHNLFSGSIQVLYDIEISPDKAEQDILEAEKTKSEFAANGTSVNDAMTPIPDFGDYNLTNINDFLAEPTDLVEKITKACICLHNYLRLTENPYIKIQQDLLTVRIIRATSCLVLGAKSTQEMKQECSRLKE